MSNPLLRTILRKLNFTSEESEDVQMKAESYGSQLDRLMPGRSRLGVNVRAVICLHLACKSLGLVMPHKTAVAVSGTTETKYNEGFKELAQILKLEKKVSLSELVVQFGCPYLHSAAEKVHCAFITKFSQPGTTTKERFNPNSSTAVAACFYATCQHYNVKVDKNKLVTTHITYPQEFKFLVNEADLVCKAVLAPPTQAKTDQKASLPATTTKLPPTGPRKLQLVSPYAGYSMLPFQHLENTRRYHDYLNWKQATLKEAKLYSL